MSKLGYRLQRAMDALQMTQQELAKKCDNRYITQSYISNIITGRSSSPRKLKEIARVLGVEVSWLLHGVSEKKAPPNIKIDKIKREMKLLIEKANNINKLIEHLDT